MANTQQQRNGSTPPLPSQPQLRQRRMTLASVIKGKQDKPYRLLVHGVDGVGKSTFGASAPEPIFLGTEDGTEHLDVARFPTPECWEDVMDAIRELSSSEHPYQTFVLDSLDWTEPLVWQHICAAAKVSSVEEIGGGYGKGYQAALDVWRIFYAALERLEQTRKMNVILLAHSFIKSFKNPQGEDFDRYILKMNEKAAALAREWSRSVYFANYETFAVKDKAKRVRGVSTGARLLYTQRTAAYDAKDHYELPEQIALSWEEFERAAKETAAPDGLAAEIRRKAAELGGDVPTKVEELLTQSGANAQRLAQINNRLNVRLAERAEKEQ